MRIFSKAKKSSSFLSKFLVTAIVLAVIYVVGMAFVPVPQPTVALNVKSGSLDTGDLIPASWPSGGAAIGAVGSGVLAANDQADTPKPIASIAKVILATAVLKQKPFDVKAGSGETITFTQKDVDLYTADLAQNGSVVPVSAGETISEYQALEALLLPSGNNIAGSLANWAFGSQQQYITYATNMLHDMGLTKTHLADASGFSPQTVSTPRELVQIGIEALKNPVIKQIVNESSATLPGVGAVNNVNADLGQRDINGIKTGNTDAAGGCLLFSATRKVGDSQITLVGAVLAQADLQTALTVAPDLVDEGFLNFIYVAGLPQHVGTMTALWAPAVNIVPKSDVSQVVWTGTPVSRDINVKPGLSGVVGQAKVGNKTSDLLLDSAIPKPTIWWRLTHPIQIIKALFV